MALVRADVNGNISVSSDWMWLLNARLHHIDHRPSLCRFLVASVPRHCQWHRIASELLILSVGKAARIGLLSTPLSLVAEMGTHCYTYRKDTVRFESFYEIVKKDVEDHKEKETYGNSNGMLWLTRSVPACQ